jgi:hypothetical protein
MKLVRLNTVWQTIKKSKEKKYSKTWALLKLAIRIAYWIWRLLSHFLQ